MENKEINLDIEKENAEITFKNLGNKKEENSQDKINKPQELKEFNVLPHFKENIVHTDKNCKEAINEYSYYCFTCKHSVCGECGIYNHKDHLLIQRENCLTYDKTFFNEISKVIDDSISVQEKKNEIIQHISTSIESLKKQLDEIKDKKVEEINKIFESISSSLIDLKKIIYLLKNLLKIIILKMKIFLIF